MSFKTVNDGELEEGEIADESFWKVIVNKAGEDKHKYKKLPKRYMLNTPKEVKKKRKHECSHVKKQSKRKNREKIAFPWNFGSSESQAHVKTILERTRNTSYTATPKENLSKHIPPKKFNSNRRDNQRRNFDNPKGKTPFLIFDSHATPPNNKKLYTNFQNFCIKSKSAAYFDTSSSYEDLLAQYKSIKSELDSMKQNEKCKKSKDVEIRQRVSGSKSSVSGITPTVGSQDGKQVNMSTSIIRQRKEVCHRRSKNNLLSHNRCKGKFLEVVKENGIGVDEEDDLQLLRREALASRHKIVISSGATNQNNLNCNSSINTENCVKKENISEVLKALDDGSYNKFCNKSLIKALSESKCSDNYDLVDMEIDSEEEFLNENMCDKKKLSNFDTPSSSVCSPESNLIEDEEVDEELLRAELILSLGRKKPEMNTDQNNEDYSIKTDKKLDLETLCGVSTPTPELETFCEISAPLEFEKSFFSVSNTKQVENSKDNTHQLLMETEAGNLQPSTKISFTVNEFENNTTLNKEVCVSDTLTCFKQQPLVISLQDDSSSEESENDDGTEDPVNAIASLELLVRHARNKSSSNVGKDPSEAVACLSKAQQQEYSKLREIIAQKESLRTETKVPNYTLQDLQSLEKKLNIARAILKKRNEVISVLRIQAMKEKLTYKKYLLNVARLKAQLQNADLKKKKGFQSLTIINSRIRELKTGCDKHLSLITDLERNCKKLGLLIIGANYQVPVHSVIASKITRKKA